MKVLIVHNSYQQPGGEDAVVAAEARLLRAHEHTVLWYKRHNDELNDLGPLGTLAAGIGAVWSRNSVREVRGMIARDRPDVAHFHNTFPLISSAAYYACAEARVPVVQTLHNYRLLCPGANLQREGRVCEECIGRSLAWPGLLYGCYRGSRAATAAATFMLAAHRAMRTWAEKVDIYVALSEFARRKFVEGGLPAERVVVKPNFVEHDPGPKSGAGDYALYVGRLSAEKGLRVLLRAWELLGETISLKIAGDGPLTGEIASEIRTERLRGIELLGRVRHNEILSLMHGAAFLVLPSICYENFPLVIAEAFACGLPVIASRFGAMEEIIADGETGLGFELDDPNDLASKVQWAWTHRERLEHMGRLARGAFEKKYQATTNYEKLIRIYEMAVGHPIRETLRAVATD